MSEQPDTEALVRDIVTGIVDNPDDVEVAVSEQGRNVNYEITVHDDDIGKVIGRQGRVIRAIRVLARASGIMRGKQVYVDVIG